MIVEQTLCMTRIEKLGVQCCTVFSNLRVAGGFRQIKEYKLLSKNPCTNQG